jgi:hypothetical protein
MLSSAMNFGVALALERGLGEKAERGGCCPQC